MLDRATACLKSGAARDSRKCIQGISRSKRLLHSTFWSHGAGDLGLPPWALPASFQGDSKKPGSRRSQKNMDTELLRQSHPSLDGHADGVFLDFLYPPQALAWLRRVGGQHHQRWETRNARRLPEGFIVASRAYSSRPQWQQDLFAQTLESVVQGGTGPSKEDAQAQDERGGMAQFEGDDEASVPREESERGLPANIQEEVFKQNSEGDLNAKPPEYTSSGTSVDSSTVHADFSPMFDFEEPDLPSEHRRDEAQQLRNIMSFSRTGRAKNRLELTERAIQKYNSLQGASKDDVRLKREFVEWLSVQDNSMAQRRCVDIYTTIPTKGRTLQTHQAALSVYLAWGNHRRFHALHREALANIENGHQISRILFSHGLEKRSWEMVMKVEREHHDHYAHTNQATQIPVFWLHISEQARLLSKALGLVEFLRSAKGATLGDHERRFCGKFFREAVTQEFIRNDGVSSFTDMLPDANLSRIQIRSLMAHIAQTDEEAPKFFEEILLAMLQPSTTIPYAQLHHLVSWIYAKYRKMPAFRPSEHLLMLWLERLTEYSVNQLGPMKTSHSVSLAVIKKEWRKHFTHISKEGVKRLMKFHAKLGEIEQYEALMDYLRSTYPHWEDQKDILWTSIWIHAKRADLDRAQQAFAEVKRITGEHGNQPNIQCWNMLLLAHSRADDLEGALVNFQNLVDQDNMKPDKYSFHNMLQLFAKRGDVEGVESMLRQYDVVSNEDRNIAHLGSLLTAHINNDDVRTAEVVLQDRIPRVRRGEEINSLTGCFNIIMASHAMRRDLKSVLRTYRWMKKERVNVDGNSYAALMQALVNLRRTQNAYGVMKRFMPKHGYRPTAFHYAIMITGFVNNRQPQKAVELYKEMRRRRIRPTASVNTAYLKAKAILEHSQKRRTPTSNVEPVPLTQTIAALKGFLRGDMNTTVPSGDPFHGMYLSAFDAGTALPAAHFDFLIQIHGQRGCFEAVLELNRRYKEEIKAGGGSDEAPPIKLLTSLASVLSREEKYIEVEECWRLAKEQADRVSMLLPAPNFIGPKAPASDHVNALKLQSVAADDPVSEDFAGEQGAASESATESNKKIRRAPGRRQILSRILRFYLVSLQRQNRIADAIHTVVQVISEGYTMDNSTWNSFIRLLCRNSPPLTLLAFVLMERFLTPGFPGWSQATAYPPRPEAVAVGLQYIKARYLPPGTLMPRYDTLVWLGKSVLAVRRQQALGRGTDNGLSSELSQYVGTFQKIRRLAPKTLSIVQSMPQVPDQLQAKLLGAEG